MTALDMLRRCPDVVTLKPALHRLCEKFGRVSRLDVLTAIHEGTRQAICFLRLESPEREQLLMQTLGVGRFGGEIVFVVDLNQDVSSEFSEPSSQWAEFDDVGDTFRGAGRRDGGRDFQEPPPATGGGLTLELNTYQGKDVSCG